MNRNQKKRSRRRMPWFALTMLTLSGCTAVKFNAEAQRLPTFSNNGRPGERLYRNRLNPIDHQGLSYINQLGGGMDENGNYRQPVPTDAAFGSRLQDGTYAAPMKFDEQGAEIIYDVKGGQIVRQDYYWGGQH